MTGKNRLGWIGAIALVSILTAACTSEAPAPSQPTTDARPSGASTVKRGNTFTDYEASTWSGADPHMGTNSFYSWPYVGEYILRLGLEDFQLKPSIAESWQ